MVISNSDFDKRRKKEKEKKFGNSKPRHFPKEMAEAKKTPSTSLLTPLKTSNFVTTWLSLFDVQLSSVLLLLFKLKSKV